MHKNVCYVRYDIEEIEKLGFDKDEADILVFSNMKSIRNIAVFAVIRASKDNQVGISLRSGYMSAGQRINVQKIAIEL